MSFISDLMKLLKPIENKISVLLTKGTITRVQKDEENTLQRVQVNLGNEQVYDDIERMEPLGLSTNPDEDVEAIVLAFEGNRDHMISIITGGVKYKVKVSKGNVALANKSGISVYLEGDSVNVGKFLEMENTPLIPLDGVITGQSIDTFTGIKLGLLPGANSAGTQNSLKLKAQL